MRRSSFAKLSVAFMGVLTLSAAVASLAAVESAEQLTRTALALDANKSRGSSLFVAQCAGCHGRAGLGDAKRDIPVLAGQRRAYVIKQLADFSERDRIATQMHEVVSRAAVSEPQSWADLALFINQLPLPKSAHIGDGKFLSLGEASYEQWCSSCHEADGRGDEDGFVPSVRNQHYRYLLKEMRNLAAGHRFNVESELNRFLGSLKSDEMQGLADYMSRLQGTVRDRARLNDDGTTSD